MRRVGESPNAVDNLKGGERTVVWRRGRTREVNVERPLRQTTRHRCADLLSWASVLAGMRRWSPSPPQSKLWRETGYAGKLLRPMEAKQIPLVLVLAIQRVPQNDLSVYREEGSKSDRVSRE